MWLAGSASASCPKGCYRYKDVCACDILPQTATPVQPSNEEPPRTGVPSYQAPGTLLINPPDLTEEDEKADREKKDAVAEGKKQAGIRP